MEREGGVKKSQIVYIECERPLSTFEQHIYTFSGHINNENHIVLPCMKTDGKHRESNTVK